MPILNAFALSLGLKLDPSFSVNSLPHGAGNFLSQAQWLFDLALHGDRLHWKLLFSFVRCTGYVRSNMNDEMASTLPPVNRRFDLRARPFQQLQDQQMTLDEASHGRRRELDIHFAAG
jgi:hypothetical protein